MEVLGVTVLTFALAGSSRAQVLAPGDSSRSIDVSETTRTYLVHVPASYTGARPEEA